MNILKYLSKTFKPSPPHCRAYIESTYIHTSVHTRPQVQHIMIGALPPARRCSLCGHSTYPRQPLFFLLSLSRDLSIYLFIYLDGEGWDGMNSQTNIPAEPNQPTYSILSPHSLFLSFSLPLFFAYRSRHLTPLDEYLCISTYLHCQV